MSLPPGQRIRRDFPRFGLPPYAYRFPYRLDDRSVSIEFNGEKLEDVCLSGLDLQRVERASDFHCVTTWTCTDIRWGGIRFRDLYFRFLKPSLPRQPAVSGVVFRGQDGYVTSMLLEDLLQDDVLIADTMNEQALPVEHGAPLRLVAPAHYGYKNLKHLDCMQLYSNLPDLKRGVRAFLDHPRARVRREERGRWVPGCVLRYVYRPFIPRAARLFATAMRSCPHSEDR